MRSVRLILGTVWGPQRRIATPALQPASPGVIPKQNFHVTITRCRQFNCWCLEFDCSVPSTELTIWLFCTAQVTYSTYVSAIRMQKQSNGDTQQRHSPADCHNQRNTLPNSQRLNPVQVRESTPSRCLTKKKRGCCSEQVFQWLQDYMTLKVHELVKGQIPLPLTFYGFSLTLSFPQPCSHPHLLAPLHLYNKYAENVIDSLPVLLSLFGLYYPSSGAATLKIRDRSCPG